MNGDYALIDSGAASKLERFGPYLLVRPSPQALWRVRLDPSHWEAAHARYRRSRQGGGHWEERMRLPESWDASVGPLRLRLRPTGFGHLGVFAEQIPFWRWIESRCADRSAHANFEVLNLFAYTGGSTLAAARGGARVTHCDASKGVVQWGRENAALNGLEAAPIRWIVDDALKFLRREARRGRRYHGLVLDPPSFGRGPKGEVFKLEESIGELLTAAVAVLDPEPSFVLLSAHTPGLGAIALRHLLHEALEEAGIAASPPHLSHGEMVVPTEPGVRSLPSGSWAAYHADGEAPDAGEVHA